MKSTNKAQYAQTFTRPLGRIGIAVLMAAIVFGFAACSNPAGGTVVDLTGDITIESTSSIITIDTPLVANYTGTEEVSYQWQKDEVDIDGANSDMYTPTTAGSYTVTASAKGFNPKTSDPVIVLPNLAGGVAITPNTDVIIGTEMTAIYIGDEAVSYQWQKDGVDIDGANSTKHTPTAAGSYTVIVSLEGYSSKTSAAVVVTDPSLPELTGTITINPNTGVTVSTELTATYSGQEIVGYQWQKDGFIIIGVNSNSYTPTEPGSYTVIVSLEGYSSKISAAVVVTDPSLPELTGTITINPNTGVTMGTELVATYSGSETVAYQWQKDGVDIPDADARRYTPTAAGSYTVTVRAQGFNPKTSTAVAVTDNSLPSLSGNVTISPSTDVTVGTQLTANYSGEETVAWQWQKDGVNISDADSRRYTPTTTGSYTVTVRSTGFNSKTSAPVIVTDGSLPSLSGNVTISPNTDVTVGTQLTASYSGSETVSYQWQKNGVDIEDEDARRYTPTEAGSYTVTVRAQGFNPKTSIAVTVTSGTTGPQTLSGSITISLPDTGSIVGAILTADYSGSELVLYQWKKDGINVGQGLTTYTANEVGVYTVTVSAQGYNPKTSTPVTITLPDLAGTVMIMNPSPIYVLTEMSASYNGSEQNTSFTWQRDGVNVGTGIRYTPSEVGRYTVTVIAPGYNSKASAHVDVFLRDLSGNVVITPNSDVTVDTQLSASYTGGSETVSYQWRKDGVDIPGANSSTYTPSTAGIYTVVVSAAGYKSMTSNMVEVDDGGLQILSGQVFIQLPNDPPIYVRTLLTAAYGGTETGIRYQWRIDGNNIPDATNFQYTPTTDGNYTVSVARDGYNSKTSSPLEVILYTLTGDVTVTATTTAPAGATYSSTGTLYVNSEFFTTVLNANYSGAGTTSGYQWTLDGANVGTGAQIVPTKAGTYKVTASREDYYDKESGGREVRPLENLVGNVTIMGSTNVNIGTTLSTATWSNSEELPVYYQWKRNGSSVNSATSGSYRTPIRPGSVGTYTIVVSKLGYNPKVSTNTVNVSDPYTIGSTGPSGVGKVFYVSQNGFNDGYTGQTKYYMEVAPQSDTNSSWVANGSKNITNTNNSVGYGRYNTELISSEWPTASISPNRCKDYRGGGLSDWFLPSLDELQQVYSNKATLGINTTNYCWSSSQTTSTNGTSAAYSRIDFANGNQGSAAYDNSYRWFPVRYFGD